MSEEWGPWIEHDGRRRPVADGTICEVQYAHGGVRLITAGSKNVFKVGRRSEIGYYGPLYASSWVHSGEGNFAPIIRYRIRKPRGLTILEGLLENLPESVDA